MAIPAVDARTICATNVDIDKAIREGQFREDLYYRISVISITLPPLRTRGDDILVLAHYFLRMFNDENKKRVKRFSPSALNFLKNYEWPGNVRELRNRVQRAIIMCDTTIIEPADLGCEVDLPLPAEQPKSGISLKEARERVESELIAAVMERQHGNIVKAAEELGVTRPTLYDLMKKHGFLLKERKHEADS